MRNSYLVRSWSSRLSLSKAILDHLGLPGDGLLYGLREHDRDDEDGECVSAVLSPIPISSWTSAYKLTVSTAGGDGQVNKVTQTLAEFEINVLSMSVAACSATAETYVTAIIDLTADNRRADATDSDTEKKILESLEAKGCLSTSPLFIGQSKLRHVRLSPLAVLNKLGLQYGKNKSHLLELRDSTIDLHGCESLLPGDLGPTKLFLVVPDTEERYVRICTVRDREYAKLSFRLSIISQSGTFSGYVGRAVKVLADDNVNIFAAQTTVTSKTEAKSGSEDATEVAVVSFAGDFRKLQRRHPGALWGKEVEKDIVAALEEQAATDRAKLIVDRFSVRRAEEHDTLVFVATNARPAMRHNPIEQPYLEMAKSLVRRIKARGLVPVNVDRAVGEALRPEIEELIDLCPLLVALYVPEADCQLAKSRESGGHRYAPSDFTVYEEAYARAKRDVQLMRLMHEDVFPPRFASDKGYMSFNKDSAVSVLKKFDDYLDIVLRRPEYEDARARRVELMKSTRVHWQDRDLEDWLSGRYEQY